MGTSGVKSYDPKRDPYSREFVSGLQGYFLPPFSALEKEQNLPPVLVSEPHLALPPDIEELIPFNLISRGVQFLSTFASLRRHRLSPSEELTYHTCASTYFSFMNPLSERMLEITANNRYMKGCRESVKKTSPEPLPSTDSCSFPF